MKRTPPTIEKDDLHGKKMSHPSYGIVQISRCSGQVELFDSALQHQHFISLSISPATKHSDSGHDFVISTREDIVEVWMSETQFARAITSMNMGSGSPCTINRVQGKAVPSPEKEDILNSHTDIVKTKLSNVMASQVALSKQIEDWQDAKHRPTLKELNVMGKQMHTIASHFESNMGYYASCFEEHMERVVSEAKTEIETHVLATTDKLGIRDDLPILEME